MSQLLHVIRRELVERRTLMIGALAIGAMILLIAFAPGNPPIPDIWNVLSMWWAIIALLGLSVYTGSSFIASDLRENRFSFYLARPMRIRTVWAGKMFGGVLLSMICAFLVVVPVTLTGNGLMVLLRHSDTTDAVVIPVLAGLSFVLVTASHAAGIILRARSAWLLLDFAAISISSIVLVLALRPLFMSFAFGLVGSLIAVTMTILCVTLAFAGYLGIEHGRTDLTRVHRTTSWVAAIALLATSVTIAVYSWCVQSTRPEELQTVQLLECGTLECTPIFTGSASGRGDFHPLFAAVNGSVVPMPTAQMAGSDPDSDWAVWIAPNRAFDPMWDLHFISPGMEEPASLAVETGIWQIDQFAIRGDRLAYIVDDTITVIDIRQDDIVLSMKLNLSDFRGKSLDDRELTFIDDDHLLLIEKARRAFLGTHVIHEIDLANPRVEQTGSFDAVTFWRDGDYFVRRLGLARGVLDPRTGETLVTRDADDVVIVDDRAIFERGSRPVTLEITDLQGNTLREIHLDGAVDVIMSDQVHDGRLPVAVRDSGRFSRDDWRSSKLFLVDLERGAQEAAATNLVPARLQNPRVTGPWYLQFREPDAIRLVRYEPGHELQVVAGLAD